MNGYGKPWKASRANANDTFLCPKHSVPMTKSNNNVFIRKIHLEEKP